MAAHPVSPALEGRRRPVELLQVPRQCETLTPSTPFRPLSGRKASLVSWHLGEGGYKYSGSCHFKVTEWQYRVCDCIVIIVKCISIPFGKWKRTSRQYCRLRVLPHTWKEWVGRSYFLIHSRVGGQEKGFRYQKESRPYWLVSWTQGCICYGVSEGFCDWDLLCPRDSASCF